MTFVREQYVGYWNTFLLHRIDDLIGLGLIDAWIVGALPDQQRLGDITGFVERRTRLRQCQILGRIRFLLRSIRGAAAAAATAGVMMEGFSRGFLWVLGWDVIYKYNTITASSFQVARAGLPSPYRVAC